MSCRHWMRGERRRTRRCVRRTKHASHLLHPHCPLSRSIHLASFVPSRSLTAWCFTPLPPRSPLQRRGARALGKRNKRESSANRCTIRKPSPRFSTIHSTTPGNRRRAPSGREQKAITLGHARSHLSPTLCLEWNLIACHKMLSAFLFNFLDLCSGGLIGRPSTPVSVAVLKVANGGAIDHRCHRLLFSLFGRLVATALFFRLTCFAYQSIW